MTTGRPDETEEERADRNFGEILQELRVGQTGVQILFGFLLTAGVFITVLWAVLPLLRRARDAA